MTVELPPLLSHRQLRDACEETADIEQLAPELIEKDYYLTRLLWAFAQSVGTGLLLKGGTLLSKVDLGFRRTSEDVDLVVPWGHGRSLTYGSVNASVVNGIARTIHAFGDEVGVRLTNVTGTRWPQDLGVIWDVTYDSPYGTQGIQVEVSLRYVLREPRQAKLAQLLPETLAPGYGEAVCYALDRGEARAEKVHAAFTRRAVRDYYDLSVLLEAGFDFTSPAFVGLVDSKLRETKAVPWAEQPPRFGIADKDLVRLERDIDRDLAAVLRRNEPRFDLARTLLQFDLLWGKGSTEEAPDE